jgi:UDP-glucuronate 4-epimerase
VTWLVTGAAGFIGSHFVDRLLAGGGRVAGLDNFDPYYDPALKRANLARAMRHPGFSLVEGDLRDDSVLDALLGAGGIDGVVHLGAKAGVRASIDDPRGFEDVNVRGTLALLESMRRAGVRRLLFASSSSVYGNQTKVPFAESDPVDTPISPYAATKKSGELLCHTYAHLYGFDAWCLRFFTVYGPRQRPEMAIARFLRAAADGREVTVHGDGSMCRDFTYIDDIVDGMIGAIGRLDGYRIVNIGGSHSYALSELLDVVQEVTGAPLVRTHAPVPPGDVQRTAADTSLAHALFGFAPRTPLREGIERQWRWMRDREDGA